MIRPAAPGDVPDLLRLVRELAAYEREPDAVATTEDDLREALFPADREPKVWAHVAVGDDRVVGMALWFLTFSTWTGRHGIWLEDVVVEQVHRGAGHGLGLMRELARICLRRGYARFEWTVLDWNAPSVAFYDALGARPLDDWTTRRLTGEALAALAGD